MRSGSREIIGITGCIGSGKSRVGGYWSSAYDLPLVNIDALCAQLLEKGNEGWLALKKEFNQAFFLQDDNVDRKKLRMAMFADAGLRLQLDALMHPLALRKMIEAVDVCDGITVLVDVPLLFEAGWEDCFNRRVVVFADPVTCCRRIAVRDNVQPTDAGQTVISQAPITDKIYRADHVINNSGSWAATVLEIIHLANLVVSEQDRK